MGTLAQTAEQLRELKPPVYLAPWWVLPGALALVGIIGLLVGWRQWRRWRNRPQPPPVPETPSAVARRRLGALWERHASMPAGAFVDEVSDIVRRFLEDDRGVPAPELTTEEFLHQALGLRWLPPDVSQELVAFLGACDVVKFAGQDLGVASRPELLRTADKVVALSAPATAASPSGGPETSASSGP